MSNAVVLAIIAAVLAIHLAALVLAALSRPCARPLLVTNVGVAGVALIFLLREPFVAGGSADWQIIGLTCFEGAALLASIAGLRDISFARVLSIVAFSLHVVGSIGALLFALMFRITRLM